MTLPLLETLHSKQLFSQGWGRKTIYSRNSVGLILERACEDNHSCHDFTLEIADHIHSTCPRLALSPLCFLFHYVLWALMVVRFSIDVPLGTQTQSLSPYSLPSPFQPCKSLAMGREFPPAFFFLWGVVSRISGWGYAQNIYMSSYGHGVLANLASCGF